MATIKRKTSEPYVLDEAAIKVALIDRVLCDLGAHDFITRELPYSFNRRRADLAIIGQQFTGFEIKSDVDNLNKLDEQIAAYNKSFHLTYIATTEKHLNNIRKSVPRSVGIYLFAPDGMQRIRKAVPRKRLDRARLLSMIDRKTIERALINKRTNSTLLKKMAIEDIYDFAAQALTQEQIEGLVRMELRVKYSGGFSLFMSERGEGTVTDDLLLLGIEREIF